MIYGRDILAEFSRHNARIKAARIDYATRMAALEAPTICRECDLPVVRSGRCLFHSRLYHAAVSNRSRLRKKARA